VVKGEDWSRKTGQVRSNCAMNSHNPATDEQSKLSPAEDPLVSNLRISVTDIVAQLDGFFRRYKSVGTKYHAMPFAVRSSTHLEDNMMDMLEEVFLLTTNNRLAECVTETFSDMIWSIAQAQRSLSNDSPDIDAADKFLSSASNVAKKLESLLYAAESGVADILALKNSLNEQKMMANPDPWAKDRMACFKGWAKALLEWAKEMVEMTDEIAKKPNGLDAIFGFGD
jgi:hypothetical protein